MQSGTLLLIDGNAIMHRAYHAIPPFRTKAGQTTNVIYGFFSMLAGAIRDYQPSHVAIAFDTPAQTFRQKLLPRYQAQRPKIDDDFISQIPLLKSVIDTAGIARFELDGFEADDLIGTITHAASKQGYKTLILTGDKDIMQLVNHNTFVIAPQTGLSKIKLYDHDAVVEKLGVVPERIPDYKALAGDPSDNYTGARGIGPKTAIKLIDQFGTAELIITHKHEITPDSLREKVIQRSEDIELAKLIATIKTDVDVMIDLPAMHWEGFSEDCIARLRDEFEMTSILARLQSATKPQNIQKSSVQAVEKKQSTPSEQISMF